MQIYFFLFQSDQAKVWPSCASKPQFMPNSTPTPRVPQEPVFWTETPLEGQQAFATASQYPVHPRVMTFQQPHLAQKQQPQLSPAGPQRPIQRTTPRNQGQTQLNNAQHSMSPILSPRSTPRQMMETAVHIDQHMINQPQLQLTPAGQQMPLPMTTPHYQGQFYSSSAPRSMSPMPVLNQATMMQTSPAVDIGQGMIYQPQPQMTPEGQDQPLLTTNLRNQGQFNLHNPPPSMSPMLRSTQAPRMPIPLTANMGQPMIYEPQPQLTSVDQEWSLPSSTSCYPRQPQLNTALHSTGARQMPMSAPIVMTMKPSPVRQMDPPVIYVVNDQFYFMKDIQN